MPIRRKKLFSFIAVFIAIVAAFAFVGCGKSSSDIAAENSGVNSAIIAADRLIVYSANITLTVADPAETVAQFKTKLSEITASKGYVEQETGNRDERFYLVFRVPTENLNEFLAAIYDGGNVSDSSLSADDITERFTTAKAKKESKQAAYDRYEELLATTSDQNEILQIRQIMDELAEEIDYYDSAMQNYEYQAKFSRVTVTVNKYKEVSAYGVWGSIGATLVGSFKSISVAASYVATIIVALLPYMLIAVGIIALVLLLKFIICKIKGVPYTPFKKIKEDRLIKKRREELARERIKRSLGIDQPTQETHSAEVVPVADDKTDENRTDDAADGDTDGNDNL